MNQSNVEANRNAHARLSYRPEHSPHMAALMRRREAQWENTPQATAPTRQQVRAAMRRAGWEQRENPSRYELERKLRRTLRTAGLGMSAGECPHPQHWDMLVMMASMGAGPRELRRHLADALKKEAEQAAA